MKLCYNSNQLCLIAKMDGEISRYESGVLLEELSDAISNNSAKKLVLDFENVSFADEYCIDLIKELSTKIEVSILNPALHIKRIFKREKIERFAKI